MEWEKRVVVKLNGIIIRCGIVEARDVRLGVADGSIRLGTVVNERICRDEDALAEAVNARKLGIMPVEAMLCGLRRQCWWHAGNWDAQGRT